MFSKGRGPFMIRQDNRFTRGYGKKEPVPEMEPHGLKTVRSTPEDGLMIIQREREPTFSLMGPNTKEDSSAAKNTGEEPSKKPTDSSVMTVNGRMAKGLEEGGSINVTVRAMRGIGWMVSPMARERSPILMDGFTQEHWDLVSGREMENYAAVTAASPMKENGTKT